MFVESIARYPIKGLQAEWLHKVEVSVGKSLPLDRRFAFIRKREKKGEVSSWLSKRHLLCTMTDHKLVRVGARFERQEEVLHLFLDNKYQSSFALHDPCSIASLERWMTTFLPLPIPCGWLDGEQQIRGHRHYCDRPEPYVSIINLATLEAFAARLGGCVTRDRFRANLYLQGVASLQERSWIGKTLRVGEVELQVVEEIKRCNATSIDSKTGEPDRNLPKELYQHYGHAYCGVFATVRRAGKIRAGDHLHII